LQTCLDMDCNRTCPS